MTTQTGGVITERELEVLLAVADADDGEAAAKVLGVEPQTVATAMFRLRRKLGVKTNLQAYRKVTKGVRFVVDRTVTRTTTTTTDIRVEEIP